MARGSGRGEVVGEFGRAMAMSLLDRVPFCVADCISPDAATLLPWVPTTATHDGGTCHGKGQAMTQVRNLAGQGSLDGPPLVMLGSPPAQAAVGGRPCPNNAQGLTAWLVPRSRRSCLCTVGWDHVDGRLPSVRETGKLAPWRSAARVCG